MSRRAGIQRAHIRLEAIEDGVACLGDGQYRAVLEVGSIDFALQGETEQENQRECAPTEILPHNLS